MISIRDIEVSSASSERVTKYIEANDDRPKSQMAITTPARVTQVLCLHKKWIALGVVVFVFFLLLPWHMQRGGRVSEVCEQLNSMTIVCWWAVG